MSFLFFFLFFFIFLFFVKFIHRNCKPQRQVSRLYFSNRIFEFWKGIQDVFEEVTVHSGRGVGPRRHQFDETCITAWRRYRERWSTPHRQQTTTRVSSSSMFILVISSTCHFFMSMLTYYTHLLVPSSFCCVFCRLAPNSQHSKQRPGHSGGRRGESQVLCSTWGSSLSHWLLQTEQGAGFLDVYTGYKSQVLKCNVLDLLEATLLLSKVTIHIPLVGIKKIYILDEPENSFKTKLGTVFIFIWCTMNKS